MSALKHTPLSDWHKAAGAKTAPFAGWEMPIQYEGILAEHEQTRTRASVFDICHMGEVLIDGPDAAGALARCVTHNLATLKPGRCRYGFLLNEEGGILDDLIIYRLFDEQPAAFMAVLNASRTETDLAALRGRLPAAFAVTDISDATAKIDLQGPASFEALSTVCRHKRIGVDLEELRVLPYFGFMRGAFKNGELLISRTGYTGEFGYELYLPAENALALWEALLDNPAVKPAGLGARDTLRLEAGLPLYGQDLDECHTPAEANYDGMLTSAADYVGKGKERVVRNRLVPLSIDGRRSARHGDKVALVAASGEEGPVVGEVTSGSIAPSLGHCVALAYVDAAHAEASEFIIRASRAELPARRVALPFYTGGTARMKL